MLPYSAHAVVHAVLIEVYGPEKAARLSPLAVSWTEAEEPVISRVVQGTRRLAARVVALAL